jgi:hypothetical protein
MLPGALGYAAGQQKFKKESKDLLHPANLLLSFFIL